MIKAFLLLVVLFSLTGCSHFPRIEPMEWKYDEMNGQWYMKKENQNQGGNYIV